MCQELLKKKVFVVENKEGIVLSGAHHKMGTPQVVVKLPLFFRGGESFFA